MNDAIFRRVPNNPPHLFVANTLYMLTASTYQGVPLMQASERKAEWCNAFHEAATKYGWTIIAWVILHNHYHAVVESPGNAESLSKFTGSYHKFTSRKWNDKEGLNGRKVWWNYWDTCIRSERDYNNRVRYVLWNPVKHGLVEEPEAYPFSNYREYLDQPQILQFTGMNEVSNVPEF